MNSHSSSTARPAHFKRPAERPFTKAEKATTKIIFGNLTPFHERLMQGAMESLGYRMAPLPTPTVRAFQAGKEYGNYGQCNPTYFTTGNLVTYLQDLEATGLTKKEIIDGYVFFSAGACGPCRFGMYEAEYRHALRQAGFDGFRVILAHQKEGLEQVKSEDDGLEMNLDFSLGILNALSWGDIVNEVNFAIRPYETKPGQTDEKIAKILEMLYTEFRAKAPRNSKSPIESFRYLETFLGQAFEKNYLRHLEFAMSDLHEIEVDRLQVKPIVKITGEFWAQTTQGDGNFNMFRFLEREGAQVLVEPIGSWVMYMLHQGIQKAGDKKGLDVSEDPIPAYRLDQKLKAEWSGFKAASRLAVAGKLFAREYHKIAKGFAGLAHTLVDQREIAKLGAPFYNTRAEGGEGHMEVGKTIYYTENKLCHMVLSLKPFGCMPSTQSDGAQAKVQALYSDLIYLPIETSGEGEVNAHSRVQMALAEAKTKAKKEMAAVLERTGLTLEECRDFIERNPEMKKATYVVPRFDGIAGGAANTVLHIAERMRSH